MRIAECTLAVGVFAMAVLAKLQVTLPNSHTEWEAGSLQTIKWKVIDGNLRGRVSVELMEGSDPANMGTVATIAENVPANDMQLHWTVPNTMKSSKNYSIKVVDDGGEEYYGQYFKGSGNKPETDKRGGQTRDSGNQPKNGLKDQPHPKDSGPQPGPKKESKPLKSGGAPAESTGAQKPKPKNSSMQNSSSDSANGASRNGGVVAGYAAVAAAVCGALAM
ncbi:hypothetical protein EV177_001162 [Coemansia sp. RSA 1804]|nr:hypothetical protein EV177_001162 [Coemansia sp. RSA 1804]